jgi:hypothetical protein
MAPTRSRRASASTAGAGTRADHRTTSEMHAVDERCDGVWSLRPADSCPRHGVAGLAYLTEGRLSVLSVSSTRPNRDSFPDWRSPTITCGGKTHFLDGHQLAGRGFDPLRQHHIQAGDQSLASVIESFLGQPRNLLQGSCADSSDQLLAAVAA